MHHPVKELRKGSDFDWGSLDSAGFPNKSPFDVDTSHCFY